MREQRTLVDEARRLAPALRDRSVETNELRRLPDATWKELAGCSGVDRNRARRRQSLLKCWDEQDHHCWTADQLARGVFLYEKNMPEAFMQCS